MHTAQPSAQRRRTAAAQAAGGTTPLAATDAAVVAHNLLMRVELTRITRALNESGVPCTVLKGVPLLARLGVGFGAHKLVDNDLWVRRRDVGAAAAVLVELGHVAMPGRQLQADLERNFEHPMIRAASSQGSVTCELHWHIAPPWAFDFPESLVWARSIDLSLDGEPVRVLDPTLSLLHLAAHFVMHELSEPRTLYVLAAAWSTWHDQLDLAELRRLADETGTRAALDYGLSAAHALALAPAAPFDPGPRARIALRLLSATRLTRRPPAPSPEQYQRAALALSLVARRHLRSAWRRRLFPPHRDSTATAERTTPSAPWQARALRLLERSFVEPRAARTRRRVLGGLELEYLLARATLPARYEVEPLPGLLRGLSLGSPRPSLPLSSLGTAIARAERWASRPLRAHDTCLFRALARFALLARYGHSPRFVLGAPPDAAAAGHAWVELDGQPWLEPGQPAFPRIWTYEAAR